MLLNSASHESASIAGDVGLFRLANDEVHQCRASPKISDHAQRKRRGSRRPTAMGRPRWATPEKGSRCTPPTKQAAGPIRFRQPEGRHGEFPLASRNASAFRPDRPRFGRGRDAGLTDGS